MNHRTLMIVVGLIALVIMAPVAWYLASPLFINQTVKVTLATKTMIFPPGLTLRSIKVWLSTVNPSTLCLLQRRLARSGKDLLSGQINPGRQTW